NAHKPGGGTVVLESKQSAWALVSPDDQWIAVEERSATGEGTVRLYQKSNSEPLQYGPPQRPPAANLQNTVWQAYLAATQAASSTPQRGATIDATAWD